MSLTPATSSPIHVGQVLAGKYRVESLLGDGGMGVVLGAVNLLLDQRVALKMLNLAAGADAALVARFLREGRAAARLRSEHIARVLDCGTLEDGRPFLVTERLDGTDLHGLITAPTEISVELAVDLVMQACEGLAEAHSAGIVHRDLKPANLFLTETVSGRPLVKILDFGICKLANDRDAPSLTKANELLGTPRYMSPEQLGASRDADARTDIWALGVILYELLTKRSPFEGERLSDVMHAVANRAPRPLHDLRPDVPADLSHVALRCLAKRREDRFKDVLELSLALAAHGLGRHPSTPLRLFREPTLAPATAPPGTLRLEERTDVLVPPLPPPAPLPAPERPERLERLERRESPRRFGNYVMYGPLARGGMASVFYGCVLDGDGTIRPVALKRVRSELTDPNLATMLSDEARIAGRVQHPNVVATLDVIVDEGEPMIALEYVPGVSLSQLLRSVQARGKEVPISIAAAVAIQALSGLHAAHEAVDLSGHPLDIVHRDVSPSNILLDERGLAKIADFGVAHARGRLQRTTDTGAMKGKLGYLAPEQVHGNASRASDIYAVGVVLWEMLVGRALLQGAGGEVLAATLMGNFPSPSAAGRADAAVLDQVVMTALEHDAGRRHASAQQMAEAIAALVTPASHGEIAAFLDTNVSEELERRRSAVLAMVAAVKREDAFVETRAASPEDPRSLAAPAPARSLAPRLVVGLLVLVLVPLSALAWNALRTSTAPRIANEAPPSAPPSAAPSAAVADPSAVASEGEPPPLEPAPVGAGAATQSGAGLSRVGPHPKKPPVKSTNCTPPYNINDEGRRIWKRECFQR
jgi:serine/threonine-protein kinase